MLVYPQPRTQASEGKSLGRGWFTRGFGFLPVWSMYKRGFVATVMGFSLFQDQRQVWVIRFQSKDGQAKDLKKDTLQKIIERRTQ